MKRYELLVIGGSAGSLQVILSLLSTSGKDFDFPVPVLVVLHRNGIFESSLEELLSVRTGLTIKEVEDRKSVV